MHGLMTAALLTTHTVHSRIPAAAALRYCDPLSFELFGSKEYAGWLELGMDLLLGSKSRFVRSRSGFVGKRYGFVKVKFVCWGARRVC
jgi:hypothetical protein